MSKTVLSVVNLAIGRTVLYQLVSVFWYRRKKAKGAASGGGAAVPSKVVKAISSSTVQIDIPTTPVKPADPYPGGDGRPDESLASLKRSGWTVLEAKAAGSYSFREMKPNQRTSTPSRRVANGLGTTA